MTALLYASRFNNFDLVQMLIERGANINARNREGNTALSIAQMNENAQISDFLIEKGAIQNLPPLVPPVQQGQQQQTGGLGSLWENQAAVFQPGTYRLSGQNRDLTFTGSAAAGRVAFMRNNRMQSGSYQINDGNLTVILDGRMFVYRVDSNLSFSGNGEVWMRTGN
jgi:hypothetical protein